MNDMTPNPHTLPRYFKTMWSFSCLWGIINNIHQCNFSISDLDRKSWTNLKLCLVLFCLVCLWVLCLSHGQEGKLHRADWSMFWYSCNSCCYQYMPHTYDQGCCRTPLTVTESQLGVYSQSALTEISQIPDQEL